MSRDTMPFFGRIRRRTAIARDDHHGRDGGENPEPEPQAVAGVVLARVVKTGDPDDDERRHRRHRSHQHGPDNVHQRRLPGAV